MKVTISNPTLNVSIKKDKPLVLVSNGAVGKKGDKGDAATVAVRTTTTLAPGSPATVVNAGTSYAAILDFGIPAGAAATITPGTTTTLAPGSAATVVNVGTTSAAIFDFGIPQGIQGETGATGPGVPSGGTVGQIIVKTASGDYLTGWASYALPTVPVLANVGKAWLATGVSTAAWTTIAITDEKVKTNASDMLGAGYLADKIMAGSNVTVTVGPLNAFLIISAAATTPNGVQGAVQFSAGTAFNSDAAKFFWNNTTKSLGIGTNSPVSTLHVLGSSTFQAAAAKDVIAEFKISTGTVVASISATGVFTATNISGTNTGDQTLNGLLPSQLLNAGKYLKTDGTDASWQTVPLTPPSGLMGMVQFTDGSAFASDAAFFWDNTNKRLGIGTTIPVAPIHYLLDSGATQVSQEFASNAIAYRTYSNTASTRSQFRGMRYRGTYAIPTTIVSGDRTFSFQAYGYDGANAHNTAAINFYADGTVATDTVPMRIVFSTGTTTSASDRLVIKADGKVGITQMTPVGTLHVQALSASTVGEVIQGVASQSANLTEWQNSSGTVLSKIMYDGNISVPGGTGSEHFGAASAALGTTSLAVGNASLTTGNQSIAIGYFATITSAAAFNIAIGYASAISSTGGENIVIGNGSVGSTYSSTVQIGTNTSVTGTSALAIGKGCTAGAGSAGFGISCTASGASSISIGSSAATTHTGALSIGKNVESLQGYDQSIGFGEIQSNNPIRFRYVGSTTGGTAVKNRHLETTTFDWIDSVDATRTARVSHKIMANATEFEYMKIEGVAASGIARVAFGGAVTTAAVKIQPGIGSDNCLVLRSHATQTADLLRFEDSGGLLTCGFSKDGYLGLGGVAAAGAVFRVQGKAGIITAMQVLTDGVVTSTFKDDGNFTTTKNIGINVTSPTNRLDVNGAVQFVTGAAATVGLVIKGAASQSADLTQWQDSAGTVLQKVTSLGYHHIVAPSSANRDSFKQLLLSNGNAGTEMFVVAHDTAATRLQLFGPDGTKSIKIEASNSSVSFTSTGGYTMNFNSGSAGFRSSTTTFEALTDGSTFYLRAGADNVRLICKGVAAQTVDLIQFQNSAGTVLGGATANGGFYAKDATNPVTGRYLMYGEAAFSRKFGFYLKNGGNEITLRADSQMGMESAGSIIIQGGGLTGNGVVVGQNAAADPLLTSYSGKMEFGADIANHLLYFTCAVAAKASTAIALQVRAAASQTANLMEFQTSASVVKSFFEKNGALQIKGTGNTVPMITLYPSSNNSYAQGITMWRGDDSAVAQWKVNGKGQMGIGGGTNDDTWMIWAKNNAIGTGVAEAMKTLVLQGVTSQTGDLLWCTDSGGSNTLAKIGALGEGQFTGLTLGIRTVTSSPTLIASDYTIKCNCTSGAQTVTLPTGATQVGRILVFKKVDTSVNAVTIGTVDGATLSISTTNVVVRVQYDGTVWSEI